LGIAIIGVGFDSPEEIAEWVEEEGFQYEMWTDTEKTLALTYGSAESSATSMPERMTFLLDEEGSLLLEYRENINFGTHPAEVLADCQQLWQ